MSEQIIIERLQAIMRKDPSELTEGEIVYLTARRDYLTLTQKKRYASVLDVSADQVDAGEADTQEEDESTESTGQEDQTEDQTTEAEDGDESSEQDESESTEAEDVSGSEEEVEQEIDLMKLRRPELEELAEELGVEDPASLPNMGKLREAIQAAYEAAE